MIFVSHDLGAIGRLCERTLWLDRGRVAHDGATTDTLQRYFAAVGEINAGRADLDSDPHLAVALKSVWLATPDGEPISEPQRYEPSRLWLRLQVRERIPGLDVGFYIANSSGVRVLEDTLRVAEPASELGNGPRDSDIGVTLPGVLRPDDYLVGIYVYAGDDYFVIEEPLRFRVAPAQGESDDGIRPAVRPRLSWTTQASS